MGPKILDGSGSDGNAVRALVRTEVCCEQSGAERVVFAGHEEEWHRTIAEQARGAFRRHCCSVGRPCHPCLHPA